MGVHEKITANSFPLQGSYLNRRCRVFFHYDTTKWVRGKIVREDRELPHRTIIELDDGRFVLATECQYEPFGGLFTDDKQPLDVSSTDSKGKI